MFNLFFRAADYLDGVRDVSKFFKNVLATNLRSS